MVDIASLLHIAKWIKLGLQLALGPIPRHWKTFTRFLAAPRRERRDMRFLHDGLNHRVRDFVGTARGIAKQHQLTHGVRLGMIRAKATTTIEDICEGVAEVMSRRIGHNVHVSLGTVTTTKAIQLDPNFQTLLTQLVAGASQETRTGVLYGLAEKAGGKGPELADPASPEEPIVVTRVRSKNMPLDRVNSSHPFWLVKSCPAHEYFENKPLDQERGVYCPAYDLHALDEEGYHCKNGHPGVGPFKSPRRKWWEWYRAVAVFPLRLLAYDGSRNGLIGFLWLDSLKPRAFRYDFEQPGVRRKWPASMHLIHAVGDAVATVLAIELFYGEDLSPKQTPGPLGEGLPLHSAGGPRVTFKEMNATPDK